MTGSALLSRLGDILWPRRCIFCQAPPEGEGLLCAHCAETLPFIDPESRPLPVEFTEGCFSALLYEAQVRESVRRFKFQGCWHYSRPYAALMAAQLLPRTLPALDRVTFVPTDRARLRQRGYNPAELLARSLCRRLELPPPEALLRKVRRTPHQSRTSAAARRANVLGAFTFHGKPVTGQAVLLIDDVITTGATVSECARMLLSAGAAAVYVLTLCRAEQKGADSGEK